VANDKQRIRILIEAYTQASSDGDMGTAEALLRELMA
jgi:hypothetical protein